MKIVKWKTKLKLGKIFTEIQLPTERYLHSKAKQNFVNVKREWKMLSFADLVAI